MSRYIDADALYKVVTERYSDITAGSYPYNYVAFDMANLVKKAPTVDAVEVRHGYWVRNEGHSAYESEHFCSECLADGSYDVTNEKYCYNCGAKMDGKRREQ
jgi:hypothetical protein